jgi:predicted lipoprotein with Yx(FWY)xxD motif
VRRICALGLGALALALTIAACGGGGSGGAYGGGSGSSSSEGSSSDTGSESGKGNYSYAPPTPANGEAEESGNAYVALGNSAGLGMVLVDSKGFVLYDFHKDKGTTSACYGACAEGWPPLLTAGEPKPSNGANASLLGTAERRDGTTQVTYNGHPLYTFAGDQKPGEANGNDISAFGGEWYALKGNGEEP